MEKYILDISGCYWFWGAAGFVIAVTVLVVPNCRQNGCSFWVSVAAASTGLIFGLIGTRLLWMVIFRPEKFISDIPFVFAFWKGTGTWLGSCFGAVGVFIALKIARKPFWSNMGSMAAGLALGHAVARIGCIAKDCCYGTVTNMPWAVYSHRLAANVHPVQIYSALSEILVCFILQFLWLKKSKCRKYLYPLYVMMLSSHRFIEEFFRADAAGPEIIPGLRVYQSVCVFLFLAAVFVILVLRYRTKSIQST